MKRIQGSVEVTSVNQVEDINKFGVYTISCNEDRISQFIDKAIELKVTKINAAKTLYSFNDLRDLESKLVLIRGRSTKGGEEIDRFFNVRSRYHHYLYKYPLLFTFCRFFVQFVELQKRYIVCKMLDTLSTYHGL